MNGQKEFKIGEVFTFGLKKLKCIEDSNACLGCCFLDMDLACEDIDRFIGPCEKRHRSDNTDVVFVEL